MVRESVSTISVGKHLTRHASRTIKVTRLPELIPCIRALLARGVGVPALPGLGMAGLWAARWAYTSRWVGTYGFAELGRPKLGHQNEQKGVQLL